MSEMTICPGCRAELAAIDGPTHRYIGASAACWAVYGQVLTRDFGAAGAPREHRLVVDAYAAQHPGTESLQAIRSVAGHLIALHFVLERDLPPGRITELLRRYAKRPEFRWLDPPSDPGALTVVDVHSALERAAYAQACRQWAAAVWESWCSHHETIRRWASDGTG